MADFLKKLKSLVGHPDAVEPPKESVRADKESAERAKETARREKEAAERAKEATRSKKEAARREQEDTKPRKESGDGANAAAASAPMPAASAATPAAAKQRQPLDINRVNLADAWEVQYRRKQFGCTELQLKQAVAAVGDAADKVKLHLRKRSVPPKGGKQRYE